MKKIRSGVKPEDHIAQFDCRYCGARWETRKGEGRYVGDQRDGDHYVFHCSDCDRDISVACSLFKAPPKNLGGSFYDR